MLDHQFSLKASDADTRFKRILELNKRSLFKLSELNAKYSYDTHEVVTLQFFVYQIGYYNVIKSQRKLNPIKSDNKGLLPEGFVHLIQNIFLILPPTTNIPLYGIPLEFTVND